MWSYLVESPLPVQAFSNFTPGLVFGGQVRWSDANAIEGDQPSLRETAQAIISNHPNLFGVLDEPLHQGFRVGMESLGFEVLYPRPRI